MSASTNKLGRKKVGLRAVKEQSVLVAFVTQFNRVCKQILLNLVGKIHQLSEWHENREHCQEVTRVTKEERRE